MEETPQPPVEAEVTPITGGFCETDEMKQDMVVSRDLLEHIIGLECKLFSGNSSESLWRYINKIPKGKTRRAIYDLGWRCQELEALVLRLENRIEQLEKEKSDG